MTDSYGRPVQGLRKQDFRLLEDGVEQDLSDFFIEDGPISIGVVLDISGSVRNKLAEAKQAIQRVSPLESPGDEFFLVTFNDQPELVRGFTTKSGRYRSRSSPRLSPVAGLRCTTRWFWGSIT